MAVQLKEERIKPFLRWAGGKTWFIDHLEALLDGQHLQIIMSHFLAAVLYSFPFLSLMLLQPSRMPTLN